MWVVMDRAPLSLVRGAAVAVVVAVAVAMAVAVAVAVVAGGWAR